jgi:hypothetical protein
MDAGSLLRESNAPSDIHMFIKNWLNPKYLAVINDKIPNQTDYRTVLNFNPFDNFIKPDYAHIS